VIPQASDTIVSLKVLYPKNQIPRRNRGEVEKYPEGSLLTHRVTMERKFMSAAEPNSTRHTIGTMIFLLPLIFVGMETVPGWGLFKLNWPQETYFLIMGVCGAISGAVLAERHLLAVPCGTLAGLGALGATAFVLQRVNVINNYALVLVAGVGIMPGFGIYKLADYILKKNEV
jgi:hypothetical protein